MKIFESVQCLRADLEQVEFDICIASSGFESRSIFVPSQIKSSSRARRFVLGFTDRKVLARQANDRWYERTGYEPIKAEGNSDLAVRAVLTEALSAQEHTGKPVNVLFDYTSMTRVWYAGALSFLSTLEPPAPDINVYFTYAPSQFSRPRKTMPNEHMGPVPGFSGLELPDRKSALLIGLGYEKGRALGLAEYVEAAETFAFYADPALDNAFVGAVLRNNRPLLAQLGRERVVQYPLADLRATAAKLGSLALDLKGRSYRVILAPLGPKPFTFLSFLLATQHGSFDVWRVSAGTGGKTYDRPPIGEIIVSRVRFCTEAKAPGREVDENRI